MDAPTPEERAAWVARVGDQDLHRRLLDELPLARRPAVIPAGGLSDHHAVAVGVRLA